MATSVKNAIARALVEGVIIDLMLKTNTDNVVLDDNGTEVTLSAKLAEYIAALNGKATPEDITNALNSYVKKDGSTAKQSAITQQTTYNNALRQWIGRETSLEVLKGISYGVELPEDLKAEVADILQKAKEQVEAIVKKLST